MLTVYRASAGAGKTYTLTGEYLRLLFNPESSYRRILAVTFTNKATDEMKTRIIEDLHKLAKGDPSGYLDDLCSWYSWSEAEVRERAKKLLITILHDYASFNISTIDRFFQQTMRAFTREIGLQGGYGIEMDQELVLSEVIDNLLADLEKPEHKDLLGWLLHYAEDKIENGYDWRINRDIMSLSRELFKESYKQFSEEIKKDISDKQTLEDYKNDLYAIIHSVENEVKRLGEKGLKTLDEFGLKPTQFIRGNTSPVRLFEKWASGDMKEPTQTFINLEDNVDACYAKSTEPALKQLIGCVFENGLNECIKGVNSLFTDLTHYYTAKEIVRFYYTLGILTDVSRQLASYREEKNIMLIADTTDLLNKVIDNSDTPFIYEKTGTSIDHYMIDEFQDTSNMQWHNFKPLINESLSSHHGNLIVGDVKQSIYRFRNSDWKLLDEQVQKDFRPDLVREETLKENWRSCRSIVEFNNSLFSISPVILQAIFNEALEGSSLKETEQAEFSSKFLSAYQKSYQQVPPKFKNKEGHVKVEFLSGDEDKDWKEEALEKLPGVIEKYQDNGFILKDIAILVRTNLEGAMVADTLLKYKEDHSGNGYNYDIISDDALFISSSTTIRFIIALLQYFKNPDNKTNRQMALIAFATLTGHFEFDNKETTGFPPEIQEELQHLSQHSLYEISEGIYRIFSKWFPDNEQVFVQAFLDMVSEYARKEASDLNNFLKWWEESGNRKTIHTPDSQNAIRIMTVHKSKGLGFKAVILPFGDWEIDHKPTKPVILWCKPEVKPFDLLHLVPVKYSQILGKTIFAKDYFHEKLHAYIDNLNTLYVAVTRAKEELIIFSPKPKKINGKTGETEKVTSIAELLWKSFTTRKDKTIEGEELMILPELFDTEQAVFEVGNWWETKQQQGDKQTEEIRMERIVSVSPDDRLQLRLQGKDLFFDDPKRKHGSLMHEVLSRIRTSEDIPATIERFRLEGIIEQTEADTLSERLYRLLKTPEVVNWFDDKATVLNETDILFGNGLKKRPDRVVIREGKVTIIDYKFGNQKEKRYHRQVRKYMDLIHEMGYADVAGYLWYVEMNEIDPVEE